MAANISDRARPLTAREIEVLRDAQTATDADGRDNSGWFTPMDIGGYNRSDHSRILRRLAGERFNAIDERFRPTLQAALGSTRAGRFYRITDAGRSIVAADAAKGAGS